MIEIRGLQQGGKEWLRWRDGGIGGSEADVLYLGDVYGKTPYTIWLKKMGISGGANFTEVQQAHLDRGHALEPKAREEFIKRTGVLIEPLCAQSETHPYMFASLDGINANRNVIVEIKAPAEAMFKKILETGTPEYYRSQIQHQLHVVGGESPECFFWAYNPDIAPYFYIERHIPDHAHIQELIRRERQFWHHVECGIPPWSGLENGNSKIGVLGVTVLGGHAKVGKDTIGALHQHMFSTKRYAFADPLKQAYCNLKGIGLDYLEKNKEKHRTDLIGLGHGMREVHGDVWVDGVFNSRSGIYEAMAKSGAIITDCRYVNEASAARRAAARCGVPCRVIWIERPGVKPVHGTEEMSGPLVRAVSDIVLINDLDAKNADDYVAMEKALLKAMTIIPNGKQETIAASSFKLSVKLKKRINESKSKRKAIRRKVDTKSRGQRNRKVS